MPRSVAVVSESSCWRAYREQRPLTIFNALYGLTWASCTLAMFLEIHSMLCVLYLSRLRVSRRGLSSLPAWLINAMFIIFTLYNLLVTIPIFGVVSKATQAQSRY